MPLLLLFALTLFTSATLLFLVQPMIGKMLLPMLGGTPAVWNTCMVFFQALLLAGYAYAHATTAWLGVRRQALLQGNLAVVLPDRRLGQGIGKEVIPLWIGQVAHLAKDDGLGVVIDGKALVGVVVDDLG